MFDQPRNFLFLFGFCVLGSLPFSWGCIDYNGLEEPYQPYGTMINRVSTFLMSDVGTGGLRYDQDREVPPYFYSYGICDRQDDYFGCPYEDELTPPISYPAYTCYLAIEAFTRYYVYSGNEEAMERAVEFAEWVLRHLTPATDVLGGLPYSTQAWNIMGGGMDGSSIELDKAALFALGVLKLYDMTTDPQFYDAASHMARALIDCQKTDGSWSFRVIPSTGEVYRDYTSNQIPFVKLMDQMYTRTRDAAYKESSEEAWNWILENPVKDQYWANFYEDMDDPESLVNFDTLETIRELLARRQEDPGYLFKARVNFQWIEDTFLLLEDPYIPLIPSIAEQTGFSDWDGMLAGTSSSTAQWASVSLDMHQATGIERFLMHGTEAANVAVSAQQPDGRMFTVTKDANGAGFFPITWYEQCFAPLYFVLDFMGNRPDTAPAGENHMLSYSAPIRQIVYESHSIRYRTTGPGTEVLKVSHPVGRVVIGGTERPNGLQKCDDATTWTYDPKTGLLTVQHILPDIEVFLEK